MKKKTISRYCDKIVINIPYTFCELVVNRNKFPQQSLLFFCKPVQLPSQIVRFLKNEFRTIFKRGCVENIVQFHFSFNEAEMIDLP